jgi:pseudouridine-5'-phosphate glycosidase
MELFAGIDLHSNNRVVAMIDSGNKKIFKKKNDLQAVLESLESFGAPPPAHKQQVFAIFFFLNSTKNENRPND